MFVNGRDAIAYCDGGQAAAACESSPSHARHAVGNRDGGQAAAITESRVIYACHIVSHPAVVHRGRDVDCAGIGVLVVAAIRIVRHRRRLRVLIKIVIDAVNTGIIRPGHCGQDGGKEEENEFLHR